MFPFRAHRQSIFADASDSEDPAFEVRLPVNGEFLSKTAVGRRRRGASGAGLRGRLGRGRGGMRDILRSALRMLAHFLRRPEGFGAAAVGDQPAFRDSLEETKIGRALRSQPRALLFAEALAFVFLLGAFDSLGGWDLSLFLFYAAPILYVGWFGTRRLSILCALVCGGVWFWAKIDTHPYATTGAYAWASLNRLAYFLFVAIGGTAMKLHRAEALARMEALVRARELEQEIVRVSECEQMRIGQDLHDGLCQNLVAIDCAAACLRADLENKSPADAKTAEVIQKMLREAVVEARDLARGIFPVQMDAQGFPAALDELAIRTNRTPAVNVEFESQGEVGIEDPQIAMHLYRIAQQALSNALSHAQADRIVIRLERDGDRLNMAIADDGRGMANTNPPSRGMGLRTMLYRARLIGAQLAVESTPNVGTEVLCSLALPHATVF